MIGETITSEDFASIEMDENYFKYCVFENLSPEGKTICSDFNACSFKAVDWYWGLFTQCNFIQCQFTDCTFRGAAFPDCRFIDCAMTNCQFVKDSLDGDCSFDRTIAYNCVIKACVGFGAAIGL